MIKELIQKNTPSEGIVQTSLKEVVLVKLSNPISKTSAILEPGLCLVGQGEKHIYVGKEKYVYNQNKFLLGTMKLPVHAELKSATPEKPYLGMAILLNQKVISELLLEYEALTRDETPKATGLMTVIEVTEELKDPIERLLKILGNPLDEKILGHQILREIYYYLIKCEAGSFMRNCAIQHSKAHQLAPVINYLENHMKNEISIDDLLSRFGMSQSTLHEKFKKATTLSPMQYLKRLRLNKAHQLLMFGSRVSDAALESGYNSVTQFSREFKRLFGISPSELNNG